jgi:lysophospholipase L1-like esterase
VRRLSFLIAALSLHSSLWAAAPYKVGEVLHKDDFDGGLSQWVVQQQPEGTVGIEAGKLHIRNRKGCTVWFRKKLSGPILIEYDATMAADARVSDLNCFWMATDPKSPKDLFAGAKREGMFAQYHNLRLYYVGYGGHNNTKTRFRRYPGGGERPLLPEHDRSDKKFLLKGGATMKIQLVAFGETVRYLRDGEVIFDVRDPKPYREGWFGFRTVNSHLVLDNFRVYHLTAAASRYEKAIRAFEAADKANPPAPGQTLFLGSSSIRRWDTAKSFPNRRTINRGFGGSQVSDSLAFVNRIVIPYRPRTIVFYAGDNDIKAGKSPETVLADYKQLVAAVHAKLPETRFVYVAIKPSLARRTLWPKMKQANQSIRALGKDDPRLGFVDIAAPMLGPDGKPKKDLFAKDGLHLSDKGYALWTSLVLPHLPQK